MTSFYFTTMLNSSVRITWNHIKNVMEVIWNQHINLSCIVFLDFILLSPLKTKFI